MFMIQLSDIVIPEYFYPPANHKVYAVKKRYKNGDFSWPLKVERFDDKRWLLRDGYARMLGAQKAGATELPAVFWSVDDEFADRDKQMVIKSYMNFI